MVQLPVCLCLLAACLQWMCVEACSIEGAVCAVCAAWCCRLLSCRRLRCMPSATLSSKNSSQAAEHTSYSKQQGKLRLQPVVNGKESWDIDVGAWEFGLPGPLPDALHACP